MDTVDDLAVVGAVFGGEVPSVKVEVIGGGLDIEGVVGDDLEFSVFFDYLDLTDYTFTAFVILHDSPFLSTFPLTIEVVDIENGLITIKLSLEETKAIGPVSRKPWFLRWTDWEGKDRTVLAGRLQLNKH